MESVPKILLEKYPHMAEVGLALEQDRDGVPITARCGKCSGVLRVEAIATTGSTTVFCTTGCTRFRLVAKPARRDILKDLHDGSATLIEIESCYDATMDSAHGGRVPELLGLSSPEYSALAHGVHFDVLSKWRYSGWPTTCLVCDKEIDIAEEHWLARDLGQRQGLAHVACAEALLSANSHATDG